MKRLRYIILLLLAAMPLSVPSSASAQSGAEPAPMVSQAPLGTEYFVAFMQNGDEQRKPNARFLGVLITSQVPTTGTIEIPVRASEWETRRFSTQPGQVTMVELPGDLEQQGSEEIGRGGVHILSRDPVAVFALDSRYLSSAGYPVLPVSFWRNRYLPISFPYADGDRNSEVMIVAAYDNTVVKIRPSARLYTKLAGEEITLSLKRGETYQFQAYKDPSKDVPADLSGSEISSTNYPIGVISGHVRTPVTVNGSYSVVQDYASAQASMLLPDSLWGMEYYSVPLRSEGDRFRVIGGFYNTTLTITYYKSDGSFDRSETVKLNRGDVFDTRDKAIAVAGPVHWSATRPVMVMQYRTGKEYGDPFTKSPTMMELVPTEGFSPRTLAVAPSEIRGEKFSHALTLIVRSVDGNDPFGSVTVDGKPIRDALGSLNVRRIAGTNYYYATGIALPSGGHVIMAENGHTLSGTMYGGTPGGDAYSWSLPQWMPQVGPDVDAPYLTAQAPNSSKGVVSIDVSDRTQFYFSGIKDVSPFDSPGWERVQYSSPLTMDDDASATFIARSDPSGPLTVQMCDNVGNCRTVEFPAVCFKTAFAEQDSVTMKTDQGLPASADLTLSANICGDAANITKLALDGSTLEPYLDVVFADGSLVPTNIASGANKVINLRLKAGISKGTYTANLRITADDSTITVPITVKVDGPSGVYQEASVSTLDASIYPNPFTVSSVIAFNHPLERGARVTITDAVGRIVREFRSDELSGRKSVEWDGSTRDGVMLSAGSYLVRISDGSRTIIKGVTLLR